MEDVWELVALSGAYLEAIRSFPFPDQTIKRLSSIVIQRRWRKAYRLRKLSPESGDVVLVIPKRGTYLSSYLGVVRHIDMDIGGYLLTLLDTPTRGVLVSERHNQVVVVRRTNPV